MMPEISFSGRHEGRRECPSPGRALTALPDLAGDPFVATPQQLHSVWLPDGKAALLVATISGPVQHPITTPWRIYGPPQG